VSFHLSALAPGKVLEATLQRGERIANRDIDVFVCVVLGRFAPGDQLTAGKTKVDTHVIQVSLAVPPLAPFDQDPAAHDIGIELLQLLCVPAYIGLHRVGMLETTKYYLQRLFHRSTLGMGPAKTPEAPALTQRLPAARRRRNDIDQHRRGAHRLSRHAFRHARVCLVYSERVPGQAGIEMNQAPQFYENIVALNERKHRDMHVRPAHDYGFARDTNAVVIAAAEFAFAALEYPIVFLDVAGRVTPVAVIGLEPGQNLFLGEDGDWQGRYVPAYVRRYPFMLVRGSADSQEMTVCIDEASERLNDSEGDRLFEDDGRPTAYLDQVLAFLKDYDRQARLTEALCERLAASTLLEPMQANVNLPDGAPRSVGGFLAVNRDALKALGPEQIYALLEKGELELIYSHLLSLRNFGALADRQRGRAAQPKAAAKKARGAKKKKGRAKR
jgi:hypothetical protein